jgi:hypothetical protein
MRREAVQTLCANQTISPLFDVLSPHPEKPKSAQYMAACGTDLGSADVPMGSSTLQLFWVTFKTEEECATFCAAFNKVRSLGEQAMVKGTTSAKDGSTVNSLTSSSDGGGGGDSGGGGSIAATPSAEARGPEPGLLSTPRKSFESKNELGDVFVLGHRVQFTGLVK